MDGWKLVCIRYMSVYTISACSLFVIVGFPTLKENRLYNLHRRNFTNLDWGQLRTAHCWILITCITIKSLKL
jgi:hypothetical protein